MFTLEDYQKLDLFLSKMTAAGDAVFEVVFWRQKIQQEIVYLLEQRNKMKKLIGGNDEKKA